jgi:Holliday junction resolvase RusA-like endonuclease
MIPDSWVVFTIPLPPSTNTLTRNVSTQERATAKARGVKLRGRVKTEKYRAWCEDAGWEIKRQMQPLPHFPGPFLLYIDLPGNIDVDNIKAVPDLLRWLGIIEDDARKYMREINVRAVNDELCIVRLRAA